MKKLLHIATLLLFLLLTGSLPAQSLWRAIEEDKIPALGTRYIVPTNYQTFALNEAAVKNELKTVPDENSTEREARFTLPMPDGTYRNFNVVNAPVMATELGRKYPESRSRCYLFARSSYGCRV